VAAAERRAASSPPLKSADPVVGRKEAAPANGNVMLESRPSTIPEPKAMGLAERRTGATSLSPVSTTENLTLERKVSPTDRTVAATPPPPAPTPPPCAPTPPPMPPTPPPGRGSMATISEEYVNFSAPKTLWYRRC
jgi:hypothetical protein